MSSDNGLGHLVIAIRELALIKNPHLEDEINQRSREAAALVERGVVNGPHMAVLLNNKDRVRFYKENGGQLRLLDPKDFKGPERVV